MGFRKDFIWGAATASYQIEGAAFEGGALALGAGLGLSLALGRECRGCGEGEREHKKGAEHGLAFLFVGVVGLRRSF